jgi:hypothetical protein
MWAEDNLKDYPYLLINPITGPDGSTTAAGPIGYTKPPAIPPALAGLLQVTEQDMQDILGNPAAGEKIVSNISGKAIEMIQQKLDMQTFIYMSNFAKAMKRCGEVWLGMARELYADDGRKMKTVAPDGLTAIVEMMRPIIDETGAVGAENDLTAAQYDVTVDVGPSSSSKRAATVRALTGMMAITQDPETAQVLQGMAMMNMEGEGISDARDYFRRKLVQSGVLKPTEEEAQQMAMAMQGQTQDPNAIYLQSAAEEAMAKAARARADTVKVVADAELSRAKTAQIMSDIDESDGRFIMDVAAGMRGV